MNEFLMEICTPEGNAFSGNVIQLSIRSEMGELAVMAGHVPFVATLVAGECRLYMPDGYKRIAKYDGGLLVVSKEKTMAIVQRLAWME